MERPKIAVLSHHAIMRAEHREVPEYVIDIFRRGDAFIAQGRLESDRTNYHIVRTGEEEYYVAIERENVAVTFVRVDKSYTWFGPRLNNFKTIYQHLRSTKIQYPPEVRNEKQKKRRERKRKRTKMLSDITNELEKLYNVK